MEHIKKKKRGGKIERMNKRSILSKAYHTYRKIMSEEAQIFEKGQGGE